MCVCVCESFSYFISAVVSPAAGPSIRSSLVPIRMLIDDGKRAEMLTFFHMCFFPFNPSTRIPISRSLLRVFFLSPLSIGSHAFCPTAQQSNALTHHPTSSHGIRTTSICVFVCVYCTYITHPHIQKLEHLLRISINNNIIINDIIIITSVWLFNNLPCSLNLIDFRTENTYTYDPYRCIISYYHHTVCFAR